MYDQDLLIELLEENKEKLERSGMDDDHIMAIEQAISIIKELSF